MYNNDQTSLETINITPPIVPVLRIKSKQKIDRLIDIFTDTNLETIVTNIKSRDKISKSGVKKNVRPNLGTE